MPSKMYNEEDNALKNDSSKTSLHNTPKKRSQTKKGNVSTAKASQQSVYSPFVFEDEIDENAYDDILVEDGHIVNKSVRVVRSRSKVSTEFAKATISRDDFHSPKNKIGKKVHHHSASSIEGLKNNFRFNVQHYARQLTVLVATIAIIVIVLLSAGSTWVVRLWNNTPQLDARPFESSVVYARDGTTELFKYYKEERREIVDLCSAEQEVDPAFTGNCIPLRVQLAALALEDENFYYNEDGIPWSNIAGAAFDCLKSAGGSCRGGSGLSQQLVKNVTKEDDFSVERKVTELLTAIKLNQDVTKQEILFLYLNQVSFGRNAYGMQEASRSYFGKDIKTINTAEACYLAALVQKPTTFSSAIEKPDSSDMSEYLMRKNICLQKLNDLQLQGTGVPPLISDTELVELEAYQPVFIPNKNDYPYPHFRDYVTQELQKFYLSEQALATQGYKIITTLDPAIQKKMEDVIKAREQSSVIGNGANNTAALVLDGPTGEILGMVGSRDYNNTEIDGQVNIVTSPQQPGSSIKPYVYAAALNQGFNPGTILMDVPTTFEGGFRPKNYSGGFVGAVSIRNALQSSYNIPAVKAAYLAAGEGDYPDGARGIGEVFRFSEATGVRYPCIEGAFNNNPVFADSTESCVASNGITPEIIKDAYKSRCYVSSAIGGCETTMLSHATGMNTFAQEGNLRTATPFLSIVNTQTGRDIYKENMEGAAPLYPRVDAAIDPLIARQMSAILSDYGARYQAFGTALASNLELPGWTGEFSVAAKTGTTDQVRDTWTVGYTPYYTVTVWVGNTDNSPMYDNASAASAPAPIWKDIMISIHEGKEPRALSREGLVATRLNPTSGFLTEGGGYVEWLTPRQIEVLKNAQAVLANPDFNPVRSSIFTTRSPMVTRKINVNKVDGLIADPNLTRKSNIVEVVCSDSLSEFPLDPAWTAGVRVTKNCPLTKTGQNQVAEESNVPSIGTNITAANSFKTVISVNAQSTGDISKTITKIQLFINGQEVSAVDNTNTLTYTIPAEQVGSKEVKVVVTDSWGGVKESTSNAILEL